MKGLRTALFVSVAANILLVGVIGGAAISNARHERVATQNAVARAPNVRAVLQSVPAERRKAVRDRIVAAWREGRPARQEARRARIAVFESANRESYDPSRVKAAFARLREADAKVAAQFQDVLADSLSELSVEERRAALRELAQQRGAIAGRRPLTGPQEDAPGVAP